MTTVAYRDGILAADTQITYGATLLQGSYQKIHKLSNGALYGFCGSLEAGEFMRRHLIQVGKGKGHLEDIDLRDENYEAIIVQPDGKTYFFEKRIWSRLKLPYVAMGTGKEHAFGAMFVGASAKQAVKAAIKLDPNTGGKVKWVTCPNWEGERSYAEQRFDDA